MSDRTIPPSLPAIHWQPTATERNIYSIRGVRDGRSPNIARFECACAPFRQCGQVNTRDDLDHAAATRLDVDDLREVALVDTGALDAHVRAGLEALLGGVLDGDGVGHLRMGHAYRLPAEQHVAEAMDRILQHPPPHLISSHRIASHAEVVLG